jgi:hypothetical protein
MKSPLQDARRHGLRAREFVSSSTPSGPLRAQSKAETNRAVNAQSIPGHPITFSSYRYTGVYL